MVKVSIHRRPALPGPRAAVGEIVPGLYQRALFTTSAFIVITPDPNTGNPTAAIIDAGWRYWHNRPALNYLRRLGCHPADVRHLLATHWHPDHIGGMAGLHRATGAAVAAHRIEAAAMAGAPGQPIPHPAPSRHRWLRPILWPLLTPLTPPPFPVAATLEDGDRLPLLGGARVIHTPGHTPGSISLLFETEGVLLVGDAVQRFGNRLTLPTRWFSDDMEAAKASVQRLAQLNFDTICFSHFQPMRTGARAALRSLAEYVT